MVCTKTLYNYIDLGLLEIKNAERMSNYNPDDIAFIEDWMNTLPRRILGYKTPEELFELQLDIIYAA